MKCQKCLKEFEEHIIQESHDVPCYLFDGNRQGRKNQADKFGRRWLCPKCHKEYEENLRLILKQSSIRFSKKYFDTDYEISL